MDCDNVPVVQIDRKRRYNPYKNQYNLDLWLELKKRWLILGVLTSIMLAVVSPRFGAPGGPLHAEYLSLAPLSYIYYNSGRRARAPQSLCACVSACALTAAHAHVVAPALCAVAASSAADAGLHLTLVKGALLSAAGGPCAWLSLCASRDVTTAALCLATSHVTSVAAAPAALYLICGRAPIPALGPSLSSALCVLPPFLIGVLYTYHKKTQCTETQCTETFCTEALCTETPCTETLCDCARRDCAGTPCMLMARVCALVLVYFDCCERLREAEGSLRVGDVLGTLMFAVVYVSLSALAWGAYARGGLARAPAALAVCAVPKDMRTGWEVSTACVAGGAGRLPAAVLAPAQALLVAALADLHTHHPHHHGGHALPR